MRIVLDTNELIRALVRPPELATFVMAWESKRFTVIACPKMLDEYETVLRYPHLATRIAQSSLRAFNSHLSRYIEIIDVPDIDPICRDPDDDKFIATAIFGQVDYLITQDSDLLTTAVKFALRSSNIEIITIDDLILLLDAVGQ